MRSGIGAGLNVGPGGLSLSSNAGLYYLSLQSNSNLGSDGLSTSSRVDLFLIDVVLGILGFAFGAGERPGSWPASGWEWTIGSTPLLAVTAWCARSISDSIISLPLTVPMVMG